MTGLKGRLFRLRERLRTAPPIAAGLYIISNIRAAVSGRLLNARGERATPSGVAICLRFRDEAHYLDEWIRYYRAAGIAHFYLYNNFSADGYQAVLAPHLAAGYVTLIEWRRRPASPAAEEDCIRRAIGRFEWVGFFDADEFVVIKDSSSIPAFLAGFGNAPGVALHWYYFGSNGHRQRPVGAVVASYTRRAAAPNRHVKCFVQPAQVSENRNSHCWFFRGARFAVDEAGHAVFGSIAKPRAERAWINHYYFKSQQDYLQKAQVKSTLDAFGLRYNTRVATRAEAAMREADEVEDLSALHYWRANVSKNPTINIQIHENTSRT